MNIPTFTLPTTGDYAKSLERAEFRLEALAAYIRQQAKDGGDFAPKFVSHIADEITETLELLSNIDREFPSD